MDIQNLQRKIDENTLLMDRHKQRKEAAEQRLAFLAAQKAKESLPENFVQKVREAAKIVEQTGNVAMEPLKELLAILVAAPDKHYIGSDSSSSSQEGEDSDVTEEFLGKTGEEDMGGVEAFEEERRQEILEARRRLAELQKLYQRDLGNAVATSEAPQAIKRRMGEDEPKEKPDATMENNETEGLTPEQVVSMYRPRLQVEEEGLRSLENVAAKEIVPVAHQHRLHHQTKQSESTLAMLVRSKSPRNGAEEDEKGKPSPGSQSISSGAPNSEDEGQEEKGNKKVRSTRWGGQPSLEAHLQILAQERMQKQQELERIVEIDRLQKMAVVRRVAEQIQSKIRTSPY